MPTSPPVALTIAGSDCSAGAGIQADLKTFSSFGVFGLTAVTCVVAETPGTVARIAAVDAETVAGQIRLLLGAFPVAAIKTGMLYDRPQIAAACAELARVAGSVPLVVDPVMVASSGDPLLKPEAVALYHRDLIPLARLLTPNLDEAAFLLGEPIGAEADLLPAAQALAARFGCAVLVKGGHLEGTEAIDVLVDGSRSETFSAPFVPGVSTHGTGCTYSAAIAAGLAQGLELTAAVARGKRFVTAAITDYFRWNQPPGHASPTDALNHFVNA
ncbi:bifunctional hydroxymethylpyrimidine kinase/phosphomethylpyrimidine kinase [soil metagenome]